MDVHVLSSGTVVQERSNSLRRSSHSLAQVHWPGGEVSSNGAIDAAAELQRRVKELEEGDARCSPKSDL